MTARMGYQSINETILQELSNRHRPPVISAMEERAKVNFDHPKAFDWKLIRQHIRLLKEDKEIEKPIYDFVTHSRKEETEIVKPNKIILVEGIMALVDKELRSLGDLKVFIRASAERKFLRRIIT